MKTLRRLPLLLPFIVFVAILACVLGIMNWLRMSDARQSTAATAPTIAGEYRQAPMESRVRQTALFVGDDFAAWGQGFYTYPYMVCDIFSLNCNVDAQAGSGLVNSGVAYSPSNLAAIDRLPKDRRNFNADVVVVDTGRNDIAAGAEAFGTALEQYLRALKQDWPDAKIVVVVPWLMSGEQDPSYADFAAVVRDKAELLGAVSIDPLEEGWFLDVDVSNLELRDNFHPNQAGHTLIGKKLAESLERHGLLERGAAAR